MKAVARHYLPGQLPKRTLCRLAVFFAASVCVPVTACAQPPAAVFQAHGGSVYSVAYSPSGDVLVSGGADQTVRFWRLIEPVSESELVASRQQYLDDLDDDQYHVRQQAFIQLAAQGDSITTDLHRALTTTASAEVRLRVGHLLALLSIPSGVAHEGEIRAVAFSSDGKTVASAGRDNMVMLWSASSGRVQSVLKGHGDGAWSVAFSPDSRLLASGGGDQVVRIWEIGTGEELCVLDGHASTIQDLAFAPNGRTLASAGGFDKTIRLWNLTERKLIAVLERHTDAVLCIAFSPDGRYLASSGYDGKLLLWEVGSGRVIRSVDTAGGVVRCVTFSPDGRLVATAEDARCVKIWEAATGNLKKTVEGHTSSVYAVAFSPDGRQLASAGLDGIVRCWPLDDSKD